MRASEREPASILVVDDEESLRDSLRWFLEKKGYRVETAENGARAIERARQRTFHLVVTDIVMPEVDGVELLKELRKSDSDTEVIMVTGYAEMSTAVEAVRHGAYDYIFKPIDDLESGLHHVIQRALKMQRLTRENRSLVERLQASSDEIRMINSKLKKQLAIFATLNQTSQLVNTATEEEVILEMTFDALQQIFGVEKACLLLRAQDGVFVGQGGVGLSAPADEFSISLGEGPLGDALSRGETALVDVPAHSSVSSGFRAEFSHGAGSLLMVPLKAAARLIGAISILRLREGDLANLESQNQFSIIASQIAAPLALLSATSRTPAEIDKTAPGAARRGERTFLALTAGLIVLSAGLLLRSVVATWPDRLLDEALGIARRGFSLVL